MEQRFVPSIKCELSISIKCEICVMNFKKDYACDIYIKYITNIIFHFFLNLLQKFTKNGVITKNHTIFILNSIKTIFLIKLQ